MTVPNERWGIEDNKAKKAKIERSLAQDQGREFKKADLGLMYPTKKIYDKTLKKEVDIGEVCIHWVYFVLTKLEYNELLFKKLLTIIHINYEQGINLNTKKSWLLLIRTRAVLKFSEKINHMTDIAQLSFMGNLEKPKKNREEHNDFNW